MNPNDFNQTKAVRLALHAAGEPLTAGQVGVRVGISSHAACRILSRMVKKGWVTRLKKLSDGAFHRYSMAERAPGSVTLSADTHGVAERARFLRELLARPGFEGHAVLTAILQDYTHTLKLRHALAVEEEI